MEPKHYGAIDRFGQRTYHSRLERLCGYIKNDSLIRREGYTQAEIDAARAELNRRGAPGLSYGHLGAAALNDETAEERRREKRARIGNETYLRAIRAAGL